MLGGFVRDGKNIRPKYDANGKVYQPRSPGIPQCWEVGVGEPSVGENVKLIGSRYRTLRDLDEPQSVPGWDPATIRKEESRDILDPDSKVLGGRLTKLFPDTHCHPRCLDEEKQANVEAAPIPNPRLPFGLDSPVAQPSQEVLEKVRSIGHADFEEKVRVLGMTGKWSKMKLLGCREGGDRSAESGGGGVGKDEGTLKSAAQIEVHTREELPKAWQSDYAYNFCTTGGEGVGAGDVVVNDEDSGQASLDHIFNGGTTPHEEDTGTRSMGAAQCAQDTQMPTLTDKASSPQADGSWKKSMKTPIPTFHSTMFNLPPPVQTTSG